MPRECTKCGTSGLKSMTPTLYHYKISGLDNVYLKGGVTEYICPKCGLQDHHKIKCDNDCGTRCCENCKTDYYYENNVGIIGHKNNCGEESDIE